MERSGDQETSVAHDEIWGTREELLLACAVSRYGTGSWDSVAMEVQSRSPWANQLTPQGCRLRYRVLRRRFCATETNDSSARDDDGDEEGSVVAACDPDAWVEELRKLRVAELRREVERHDLSIVSLQLKVERLKEDERSVADTARPDPQEEDGEKGVKSVPPCAGGISGDDSGRSCKESNSTDLKTTRAGGDPDDLPAGQGRKSAAEEGSCDGSSGATAEMASAPPEEKGYSAESTEGEEDSAEAEKESSDVQSSASLPRRRQSKELGGSSGDTGEETETDELFHHADELMPLISFLDRVRSGAGAVFDRRLPSQDMDSYRNIVRRHVDLEIVRAKLLPASGSSAYSSSAEFFLDLLLLCNNAIVFFPKTAPEFATAVQLRQIVSKEMSSFSHKRVTANQSSAAPIAELEKPKSDSDAGLPVEKPAVSKPTIVSRKRTPIAKTAVAVSTKEKAGFFQKERDIEELNNTKKMTRSVRSGKGRASFASPHSIETPKSITEAEKKSDKKSSGAGSSTAPKKRNAVNFLNRLNQSMRGPLLEPSKVDSGKASEGTTPKKAGKTNSRKDSSNAGTGSGAGSSSRKKTNDRPTRRNAGRPPKRPAPPPTPPPAKRAKETASSRPATTAKKRGKR